MRKIRIDFRIGGVIIISILMIAIYEAGFSAGKGMSSTQPQTISVSDAQHYASQYMASKPASFDNVVKALVIDVDQFQAMSQISNANPNVSGFRIYYGMDDFGKSIKMVVGIQPDRKDDLSVVYSTSSWMSGLCPPVCDVSSPIMQN